MAREMKDSGIEWIGKIPRVWKLIPFRHVLNERQEKNSPIKSLERLSLSIDLGVTLYAEKTTNLDRFKDDFEQYKLAHKGDLVMNSMNMIVGATGVSAYFGCVSPVYYTFYDELEDHVTAKYCEYIFRSKTMLRVLYSLGKGIYAIARGDDRVNTCRLKVAKEDLKSIIIPIPPVEEQREIVRYLEQKCSELDNVIEKTRASIEEYKKLKQAVITQAVTKGIRDNRKMKDSGIEWIGEIPAEWNLIKVTRLLDYSHSYPIGDGDHGLIKTDDYIDAGVPYIRVQNLGWGTELDCDNIVYISEERNQAIANSILKPNDILFAKTGATIGKTAIVPSSMPVSNTTSHIGKMTVSSDYSPRFVFYVMSSYLVYRQFWEIAGLKSTRPELSIDEIKKIKLIIPSRLEEQQEIASHLDKKCSAIDELTAKKEQYLFEIENYKKSLIYEYVTGKKEVPQEYRM